MRTAFKELINNTKIHGSFLSCYLVAEDLKIKILNSVILPTVLYGYENLFLTLTEKHRLRDFENRIL